ncbi:hypothetical protein SAMN04488511_11248 [Pedobacter suwonensis]|uniref:Uncharacterized protein n=1 Tax=Pedobacter suwonensis TaxID=332999 RepID=A0A1I0TNT7_9SPHI|nr:hypothetical protein SAMN04488511_11248 [Pedobacter suwonensis]
MTIWNCNSLKGLGITIPNQVGNDDLSQTLILSTNTFDGSEAS